MHVHKHGAVVLVSSIFSIVLLAYRVAWVPFYCGLYVSGGGVSDQRVYGVCSFFFYLADI
jgi:hypothetical protein